MAVVHSHDPGGFCCNHLMWQLDAAQFAHFHQFGQIPWVFMHMPTCPEALSETDAASNGKVVIPLERLEKGVRAFIEHTRV